MYDVVLLSLGPARAGPAGCGDGDGHDAGCCGSAVAASADSCLETPRVPVLSCADALTAAGARVETVTARSDAEIDDVLARLDAPPRSDGLTWPDADGKTRLVVATASDSQLRAVVRRLVRRYAPPPSRRPADLAVNRTVPDLPPVGVLPLDPVARSSPITPGSTGSPVDLVERLGLPREPARVAAAVLGGRARRFDLLRNDGGSVTLDGALIGGADDAGRPLAWRGRVEVDDAVLSTGDDPLLACVVANAAGYAVLEGLPLLTAPDPTDGVVDVAVAVPIAESAAGHERVRLEVRRARGRAVAVTPRHVEVPYLDDGASGSLGRKRSWWIEPAAWAVYSP